MTTATIEQTDGGFAPVRRWAGAGRPSPAPTAGGIRMGEGASARHADVTVRGARRKRAMPVAGARGKASCRWAHSDWAALPCPAPTAPEATDSDVLVERNQKGEVVGRPSMVAPRPDRSEKGASGRGVHDRQRDWLLVVDRIPTNNRRGPNLNPKPFIWSKTAEEILESLARLLQRITGGGH